jgi:hypothetical protein
MPLATDFLNSNYFTAENLDPNVLIETAIVSVRRASSKRARSSWSSSLTTKAKASF